MLRILWDLLVANGVKPTAFQKANYWEETDAEITIDDFYHIQIGESYLILWQCTPNVMSHRAIYEVSLDKIDNTKKVKKFIDKVKTICKPYADELYDYSAE